MMSDPIIRVQADMPDAVVRIEVANQGKDGYTPKRGVDYWTEEDVQEIHDYVDEQIGTGGGGSGAVSSVNGKTGAVVLAPEDIGAQPKGDYALKEEVPQIDDAAVRAESTWSSKNTVERFLPEFSESGAAVECHPFPLCPLNVSTTFEPAQTGSGDPYPAGGGKNLLENTVATRTVNGIVFTANKDGTVTVNGTATADAWLEIKRFSADAPNFSGCVMSGCPAGGGLNTYFLRWSNNAAATATDDGKSTCVIPDAHTGSAIIAICVKSGVTASNLIFKPMIRLASITDDTYAPYSNIRPISGYDRLELTQTDEIEDRNTYTVHLGDTVYGGTYDWGKGELMAEWKIHELDGTEAWDGMLSQGIGRFFLMLEGYGIGNHPIIADRYRTIFDFEAHKTKPYTVCMMRYENWATTRISITTKHSSVDGWKAYLAAQYAAGTPVQIAYKLAEPITIQLAPLEIMPLEGTNVLSSNPGGTTVSGKLDPIYLHEQNKAAAAKLAGMETRLQALESAAVNNA